MQTQRNERETGDRRNGSATVQHGAHMTAQHAHSIPLPSSHLCVSNVSSIVCHSLLVCCMRGGSVLSQPDEREDTHTTTDRKQHTHHTHTHTIQRGTDC